MNNNELMLALSNLLENKLQPINNRLDKLESEISSLKIGQQVIRQDIRQVKGRVDETYILALDNWGQIEESKHRLELLEN